MKKFFLIPLMALLTCVMAWAADQHVSNITDLKAAIADASVETIYLDADIQYAEAANSSCINILRSVTIDGQGHTLAGYGKRGTTSNYPTVAINQSGSSLVDVTLKNLQMINPMLRVVETRGNINSLTIENCHIEALRTNDSGYDQPITIGGNQASQAAITIRNSTIKAPKYYPIVVFNPINLTLENSQIKGWNALYFKGVDSSAGSRGSVVTATNCNFDCPNPYDTPTNSFGMFVCEDDGISITLNNCGMHAEQLGNQTQTVFLLSNFASITRRSQPMTFAITGDNSYINGKLVSYIGWAAGYYNNAPSDAAIPDPCPLSITISGGTYAFNPANKGWLKNQKYETEEELYDESNIGMVTIPEGYEVKEINTIQDGVETTLYRVRKAITTAYSINADVEGEGKGQNENTEFIISANESVEQESTVANYVEVGSDATLTVGEGKTLEVTNGLDVAAGSQVVVEPGATLVVGEGGVITGDAEGIVIETEDTKPASFLLNPDVIVNTTPNLTVKMIANAGKDGEDWYWHRFAMPVNGITSWTKQNAGGTEITVPTYLQGWDYTENDWASRTIDQMVPFLGYTLTYDEVNGTPTTGETEVTYIFKGNLVGNLNKDLLFQAKGYNFFGNSYTAYIDAKTLLADVMNDPTIGGAVYMWDADNQVYEAVTMRDLRDHADLLEDFMKEIAPMQTFILQLRSSDIPTVSVDYRSTIWGNPRYNKVAASAPARQMASNDNYVKITLTAENGKTDAVRLTENAEFSAAYDNGADADKYMNSNHFNFYATVAGQDYSNVATDNIEGTMLSLKSQKGVRYTMSFSNVEGNVYAIKDMLTGVVTEMSEGNTYEFTAPEDAVSANRFMIVGRQDAPTAIEDAEMTTSAQKGIYTIMGQYLGETNIFNTLPAGVYVVDGVKVIR